MSWNLVVPTVRPDSFNAFIKAWAPLINEHCDTLIVVQDLPAHDDQIAEAVQAIDCDVELHHHGTIKAQHIPQQTDMCRSWGIYRAWKTGADYTLTLDDDVRPFGDPFAAYEMVFDQGAPVSSYLNVGALTTFEKPLRGFPYQDRDPQEVAVQYGGWHGVLDYDAPTQIEGVKDSEWFSRVVLPVPKGAAVTGCIMNAAWRTKYAPIMWQLPMLEGRFNRFGDIWAGLFAKRVCDVLNVAMVVNGCASVRHERASDPQKNLEREQPGIPVNEHLWGKLWTMNGSMTYAYRLVTDNAAEYFESVDPAYARHFRAARDEWLDLFV